MRTAVREGALLAIITFLSLCATAETEAAGRRTGLARQPNFSVFADTQAMAKQIAAKAERLRKEIAEDWLDSALPDGFGRASINVFFSERNTSRTWAIDEDGSRETHLVWIYTRPQDLDSALSHEVAHVVLANRYPKLPSFAHEAVASSYDDDHRAEIRRDALKWFAQTDRWPRVQRLLDAESIAPSDHSSYAAAVSIKDFLLERSEGERSRFLRFAEHGQRRGWSSALARFYDFRGVNDFEVAWRGWVRRNLKSDD